MVKRLLYKFYKMLPSSVRGRCYKLLMGTQARLWPPVMRTFNLYSTRTLAESSGAPIVSLTSFPPRLDTAYLAVESMFRQTRRPAAVYLWLDADETGPHQIPASLERLRKRGLRIRWAPFGLKSANKLVHAYALHADRPIVTIDDDFIYKRICIEQLMAAHAQTPDSVICHRAWWLRLQQDGHLVRYQDMFAQEFDGVAPSHNVFPTGSGAVLYPPHALDERVGDRDLYFQLCPTADDVWFKAMTMLKGVRARRVSAKNTEGIPLRTRGSDLWSINQLANDPQLDRTFRHFGLYELLEPDFPKRR